MRLAFNMPTALWTLAALLSLGTIGSAAEAAPQEHALDATKFQRLVSEMSPASLHAALRMFNPLGFRHGTSEADGTAAKANWCDDTEMASTMAAVASVAAAAASEAAITSPSPPYATPTSRHVELVRRQAGEGENGTVAQSVSIITSITTAAPSTVIVTSITTTTPLPATTPSSEPASSPAPPPSSSAAPVPPTTTPQPSSTSSEQQTSSPSQQSSDSSSSTTQAEQRSSLVVMTTTPVAGGQVSTFTAVTVVDASEPPASATARENASAAQTGSLQSDDVAAGLQRNGWIMAGGVMVAILAG